MPTQSDLRFTFVVGDVDFDVVEFTLEEGLSETYRLDLALSSFDPAIDFGQVSSTAPSTAARCATTPPPAAMRPRPQVRGTCRISVRSAILNTSTRRRGRKHCRKAPGIQS